MKRRLKFEYDRAMRFLLLGRRSTFLILLVAAVAAGCAASNKPAPNAGATPTATPQAQEDETVTWTYPDCPRAGCTDPAPALPNWECADGSSGGPACKKFPDGKCRWVIVRCAPKK